MDDAGRGNDLLDGGGGYDNALYDGARPSYAITAIDDQTTLRRTGSDAGEGIDTLSRIEGISFADGDFIL